ncbi:MAG TPA: aminotransferase DegT [Legionellales bacterium]|nr:aminotransferase DegT [Legionellales bacterium]
MPINNDFIAILKQVLSEANSGPLVLHEPEFSGNEWTYVKDCIDTGWVSSVGQYVNEFERKLCDFTGAKYAIAVVNGTAALHMALLVAGVKAQDEVLIPALSFVATANAVSHCGAIPHFVDSNFNTLGLDPDVLDTYLADITEMRAGICVNKKTQRPIRALVPMHTFGHPMDLEKAIEVCKKYHLVLIEDAAESLGSFYQGQHTGTFGDLGILSFNGNKVITTGGGGAILTNHEELAKRVRHLSTTAKQAHPWAFYHDEVAYNYRMPNLNAALGCAQLEQLPTFLKLKRTLALRYLEAFEQHNEFSFVKEPLHTQSNYWLNTVRLQSINMDLRNTLIESAIQNDFYCRPTWTLLNQLPMYLNHPSAPLPVAQNLEASLICLPSSVKLEKNNERHENLCSDRLTS